MENTSAPRRTASCSLSVIPQVIHHFQVMLSSSILCSDVPPPSSILCTNVPPPSIPASDSSCVSSDVSPSFCCYSMSGEDEQLTLKLINRPMLILRGENGFICHHRNSNTLDASRSVYDIFTLQFSNGAYHIKGQV